MKQLSFINILLLSIIISWSCNKEELLPGEVSVEIPISKPNKAVLKEETKVLSTDALEGATMEDNKLRLNQSLGDSIQVGSIIISEITEEFPDGIFKRVAEIDLVTNEYLLETVSIDEAFDEFYISFTVDDITRGIGTCYDLTNMNDNFLDSEGKPIFEFTSPSELCFNTEFIIGLKEGTSDVYQVGYGFLEWTLKGNIKLEETLAGELPDLPIEITPEFNKTFFIPAGPIAIPVNLSLQVVGNIKIEYDYYERIDVGFDYNWGTDGKAVEFRRDPWEITTETVVSNNRPVAKKNGWPDAILVGTGAIKFTYDIDVITTAYSEDVLRINPLEAQTELEIVAEVCAATPNTSCQGCPILGTVDMFLESTIDGSARLLGDEDLEHSWNYYDGLPSSERIGTYCSGCAFNFTEIDKIIDCDDKGTPFDYSDDELIYSLNLELKNSGGQSTGSGGYNIQVDGEFLSDQTGTPIVFPYNQLSNQLILPANVGEIFISDDLITECVLPYPIVNICDKEVPPEENNCQNEFQVSDNTVCETYGTTDTEDDTYQYFLTVNFVDEYGELPSNSSGFFSVFTPNNEIVSDALTNETLFSYGSLIVFQFSNQDQNLIIKDDQYPDCDKNIFAESPCSNALPPDTEVEEGEPPLCTFNKADSRDNQLYCTLLTCENASNNSNCKTWLRRNLRYSGGGSGPEVEAPYVNNDPNKWKSGRMYSYEEVESGNLCPSGYRVATKDDFESLITAVENNNTPYSGNPVKYLTADYAWSSNSLGNGGDKYSKFYEIFANGYYSSWDEQFQEAGVSANIWTTTPYVENGHESDESVYVLVVKNGSLDFVPFVKDAFRLGVRCVCESNCN